MSAHTSDAKLVCSTDSSSEKENVSCSLGEGELEDDMHKELEDEDENIGTANDEVDEAISCSIHVLDDGWACAAVAPAG
jgi:hypothetical protein